MYLCVFVVQAPRLDQFIFQWPHPTSPIFLYPTMLARNCKAPKAKAAPKKRNAEAEEPKAPARSKKNKASSSKAADKPKEPKGKSAKKLKKIRKNRES